MNLRGLGIGSMMYGIGYGFSRPDFGFAEIELSSDGTLTIWSGASELGQGLRTVLCQIAAEELGIPYEDTHIISSDTAKTPDAGPVSASRSTYVQGTAVIKATKDLKYELRSLAAVLLSVDAESLEFRDGQVIVAGDPSHFLSFRLLATEMHNRGKRVRGIGRHDITTTDVDPETSQGDAYATYAWASQLVIVEVDTETGYVNVLRLASATDAGKAINPAAVEGQIEGGAVQGLGFALMEEMRVQEGVFRNANFSTYLIPTAADVPPIDSLIVEVPEPSGPYGAKGIAEPATIPTAPAILNAIADAIGTRLLVTPASPERMLTALGEIKSSRRKEIPRENIPYPDP